MRRVINKEMDEGVLFEGLADLFSKGWKGIKLYFMMGLPSERGRRLKRDRPSGEGDFLVGREAEDPSQHQCQRLHFRSQTSHPLPMGVSDSSGGDEGKSLFLKK